MSVSVTWGTFQDEVSSRKPLTIQYLLKETQTEAELKILTMNINCRTYTETMRRDTSGRWTSDVNRFKTWWVLSFFSAKKGFPCPIELFLQNHF